MRIHTARLTLPVIGIGLLFLVGCGGDNDGIQNVTSIPADEVEAAQLRKETTQPPTVQSIEQNNDVGNVPTVTPTELVADEVVRAATPTPLDIDLEEGEARRIALATDAAFQPTPRSAVELEDEPIPIVFEEFYDGFDMRRGWTLSDKLVSLDGRQVVMEGYVAPPLKPKLDFFVLTGVQLSFCPFCSTDADWPDRMALVYLLEPDIVQSVYPVRVVGQLEVGSSIDRETGMVSIVRLYAETIEVLD